MIDVSDSRTTREDEAIVDADIVCVRVCQVEYDLKFQQSRDYLSINR